MLVPTCNIKIGNLDLTWVNNVVIESSWKNQTDTAKITLPANIKLADGTDRKKSVHKLLDHIPVGSPVSVSLSANGSLVSLFQGYVSRVHPKTPLVFECEDEMYNLKSGNVSDSGEAMTIKKVVSNWFSEYDTDYLEAELGTFGIDNLSKSQVLQEIQKQYSIHSFFRNEKLIIGKPYSPEDQKVIPFKVEGEFIEDKLEYKREEDVRVQVKAISHKENGEELTETVGDKDGDQRTLNFYGIESKAELKAIANREIKKFKYDGFRGSFTAFGLKTVRHGDVVELIHGEESQKSGKYYAEKVVYTFGLSGYRQEVTLGERAI
jgi:hypothetical protein